MKINRPTPAMTHIHSMPCTGLESELFFTCSVVTTVELSNSEVMAPMPFMEI